MSFSALLCGIGGYDLPVPALPPQVQAGTGAHPAGNTDCLWRMSIKVPATTFWASAL